MAWLDWKALSSGLELHSKIQDTGLQIIKGVLDSGDIIAHFRNLSLFSHLSLKF